MSETRGTCTGVWMKKRFVYFACVLLAAALMIPPTGALAEREDVSGDELLMDEGFLPYDGERVRSVGEKALAVYDEADGVYAREYGAPLPDPVVLLGTQTVAGFNYKYLCAEENGGWSVVTVYADLNGGAAVTGYVPFELTDLVDTGTDVTEPEKRLVTGGWQIVTEYPENLLDAELEETFTAAVSERSDILFAPLAVLGTRIGAGLDTAVLSIGEGKTAALYVVTVNEAPDGTARLASLAAVDIAGL